MVFALLGAMGRTVNLVRIFGFGASLAAFSLISGCGNDTSEGEDAIRSFDVKKFNGTCAQDVECRVVTDNKCHKSYAGILAAQNSSYQTSFNNWIASMGDFSCSLEYSEHYNIANYQARCVNSPSTNSNTCQAIYMGP